MCSFDWFLVIALMMRFCKSVRKQLREDFPMAAASPSDMSLLDRLRQYILMTKLLII